MGFCLFNNVAIAARHAHSRAAASTASPSSTSTSTTATALRTPSTRTRPCSTSRRTSTRTTRAPATWRRSAQGAGRGLQRQRAPARRLRRRRVPSRLRRGAGAAARPLPAATHPRLRRLRRPLRRPAGQHDAQRRRLRRDDVVPATEGAASCAKGGSSACWRAATTCWRKRGRCGRAWRCCWANRPATDPFGKAPDGASCRHRRGAVGGEDAARALRSRRRPRRLGQEALERLVAEKTAALRQPQPPVDRLQQPQARQLIDISWP